MPGRYLKTFLIFLGPILLAFLLLGLVQSAVAKPSPDYLRVEVIGASDLYMDFNNWCGSSGEGPDGAWYTIRLTNDTNNQTYTGLELTVTPPTGLSIDDRTRYVGNLEKGESAEVFIFIDYSQLRDDLSCGTGDPPVDFNQPLSITVVSLDGGMNGTKTQLSYLTSEGMTSASVGGQYISHELGEGAYVGQLITMTIIYGFGNNQANSALFIQPTGNGNFRDDCFRLVETEVLYSNVAGVPIGSANTLWFLSTDTENNNIIEMQYTFQVLQSGNNTDSYPWSAIISGNSEKYNASSYSEEGGIPLPAPQPIDTALSMTKTVSPSRVAIGETVTFTVRLENSAIVPVQVTILDDLLPNGFSYAGFASGSEITAMNSSISPTLGASGAISWFGYPYVTYNVPASGTVQTGLPGELVLIYRAIPLEDGIFTNQITATVGTSTLGPASAPLQVDAPTAVTLADFATQYDPKGVLLTWQTVLETDLLGFKIYRSASPDSGYSLLTNQLILPLNLGSPTGAFYSWLDVTAKPGNVYYYILEDIDTSLISTRHGPVEVFYAALKPWIYLPFLIKP